jgi:tetratricopeptide (TPR) repeat protein
VISLFLLAAATADPSAGIEEKRFADCVAQVEADPQAAIATAEAWRMSGGNLNARLCLGLAYAAQKRWPAARLTFEMAAKQAEKENDARSASFWVQAGNAALAAGEYDQARTALDAAIISGLLKGPEAGEAHLDRARALAAKARLAEARTDIDVALKLVPQDPLGWLLSATLARREENLTRAASDIEEAAKRSPDDAAIALEAGNIALLSGAPEAAKKAWEAAVRLAPDSPSGRSAKAALVQFDASGTPVPSVK